MPEFDVFITYPPLEQKNSELKSEEVKQENVQQSELQQQIIKRKYLDLIQANGALNQQLLTSQQTLMQVQQQGLYSVNKEQEAKLLENEKMLRTIKTSYEEMMEAVKAQVQAYADKIALLENSNKQLTQTSTSQQDRLSSLETELDAKNQEIQKLRKYLRDQKRVKTESFTAKQEQDYKRLMENSLKQTKQIQDLTKRNNELSANISRLRDDIKKGDEIMKVREDQLKKLLRRVKQQETELSSLKDGYNKKEAHIAHLQRNLQGQNQEMERNQARNLQKTIEDLKRDGQAKEHELNVLREMVKSWQHQFKIKDREIQRLKKTVKLPPLQGSRGRGSKEASFKSFHSQSSQEESKARKIRFSNDPVAEKPRRGPKRLPTPRYNDEATSGLPSMKSSNNEFVPDFGTSSKNQSVAELKYGIQQDDEIEPWGNEINTMRDSVHDSTDKLREMTKNSSKAEISPNEQKNSDYGLEEEEDISFTGAGENNLSFNNEEQDASFLDQEGEGENEENYNDPQEQAPPPAEYSQGEAYQETQNVEESKYDEEFEDEGNEQENWDNQEDFDNKQQEEEVEDDQFQEESFEDEPMNQSQSNEELEDDSDPFDENDLPELPSFEGPGETKDAKNPSNYTFEQDELDEEVLQDNRQSKIPQPF